MKDWPDPKWSSDETVLRATRRLGCYASNCVARVPSVSLTDQLVMLLVLMGSA